MDNQVTITKKIKNKCIKAITITGSDIDYTITTKTLAPYNYFLQRLVIKDAQWTTFVHAFCDYLAFFWLLRNEYFCALLPFTFVIPTTLEDGDCHFYDMTQYILPALQRLVKMINVRWLRLFVKSIIDFIVTWKCIFPRGPPLHQKLLSDLETTLSSTTELSQVFSSSEEDTSYAATDTTETTTDIPSDELIFVNTNILKPLVCHNDITTYDSTCESTCESSSECSTSENIFYNVDSEDDYKGAPIYVHVENHKHYKDKTKEFIEECVAECVENYLHEYGIDKYPPLTSDHLTMHWAHAPQPDTPAQITTTYIRHPSYICAYQADTLCWS